MLPGPAVKAASSGLISAIGISIMAATALAFLAYLTKQPLLLAYLAAGAAIGPQFGFGWVSSQSDIKIITEIGLILLLFMIGLELEPQQAERIRRIPAGHGHFPVCPLRRHGLRVLHAAGVYHRRAL